MALQFAPETLRSDPDIAAAAASLCDNADQTVSSHQSEDEDQTINTDDEQTASSDDSQTISSCQSEDEGQTINTDDEQTVSSDDSMSRAPSFV